MARHEAEVSAAPGVDFHLPDEILAVILTNTYEQLDVKRNITSMATASQLKGNDARLHHNPYCSRAHEAFLNSLLKFKICIV